ncbi:FA71D protein, partial [Halcyon senegalensis]|nr:FA71D protein [Halcyon senegalensis]
TNSKSDFKSTSSSQVSIMGDLQRLLRKGEYAPLTSPPILESKFVQVNQRGEPVSIHNRPSYATMGICAANPSSSTPSVMLVACEVPMSPQESTTNFWKLSEQPSHMEQLVLTRLFPLKFVELSVHSTDKCQLMLKLVNGHCYYLELCAPSDQQQHQFHLWLQFLSLLKPPENTCNTEVSVKHKDSGACHKKAPSPSNALKNRDDQQDVPNPKTKEEVVTKETSSNQIPPSSTVDPTEQSGRKGKDFHSSLKPSRQETTRKSKNIDSLHTKRRSTENKKTR